MQEGAQPSFFLGLEHSIIKIKSAAKEGRDLGLRLIIGRAGSGKTFRCVREICEELGAGTADSASGAGGEMRNGWEGELMLGKKVIFLVPEQSTFQMEMLLAGQPGLKGMIQSQVFSFRRLAWRVLQETGGAGRPYLREPGRDMVLRRLFEQRRKEMQVFQRVDRRSNFIAAFGQFIREMKMYGIGPSLLKSKAEELKKSNALLGGKLLDLAVLYEDFERFLDSRGFLDPDDYLTLLAQNIPFSDFCRGASVWVDGFSGFTPQEYKVLEALLAVSREVTVTLCLDRAAAEKPPVEGEVFFRTRLTLEKLKKIAASLETFSVPGNKTGNENGNETSNENGNKADSKAKSKADRADIEYCFLEEDDFLRWKGKNRLLAYLERHLFSSARTEGPALLPGEETGIKIIAAGDRAAEAEWAAQEIISLARDQGYRWREVVVLVRDLSVYADVLEKALSTYGIPYFIDYKRPVLHHPLVELIISALTVAASGWDSQAVFRYLKTDFPFVSREEVDVLENYVLAHGIKGKWWTEPPRWEFWRTSFTEEDSFVSAQKEKELRLVNDIRGRALKELRCFCEKLSRRVSVRDVASALGELLQELRAEEKLRAWAESAHQEGKIEEARQHLQVAEQVRALVEEMVEVLGDEYLSPGECLRVLESGLKGLKIGLIPPGLDQVVVGTLDRSRSPEARAVFILGANEGVFPARLGSGGLLGDKEREALEEKGLELAPQRKRAVFEERYLVYWGLTRASERLYVSYALSDLEGTALYPSSVISELKALFPFLREIFVGRDPNEEDAASCLAHPRRAISLLLLSWQKFRQTGAWDLLWQEVYNWALKNQPHSLSPLYEIYRYLKRREDFLPEEVASSIYPFPLKASITQIEQFMACPFAHFVRFGLRAREREVAQLRPLEMGQFFHAALKEFFEKYKPELISKKDPEEINSDLARIVEEITGQLFPSLAAETVLATERQRYLTEKLKGILLASLKALVSHMRCSRFKAIGLEAAFGFLGSWPALTVCDGEEAVLKLRGRIDRVDAACNGERLFLRVVDYKLGNTGISLDHVYHGLQLQLLAYLEAVLSNWEKLNLKEMLGGQEDGSTGKETAGQPEAAGMLYFRVHNPVAKENFPCRRESRKIEEMRLKSFRMRGLLLKDQDALELMHTGISSLGGRRSSHIIPAGSAANSALEREEFDLLRSYLYAVLREAASKIRRGEISISPYQYKKEKACSNCDFHPVCQFDRLMGDEFRVLLPVEDRRNREKFWHAVRAAVEGSSGKRNGKREPEEGKNGCGI